MDLHWGMEAFPIFIRLFFTSLKEMHEELIGRKVAIFTWESAVNFC